MDGGGKGLWMGCVDVGRGGRKQSMRECGGGFVKALVNKNLVGKLAVVVAVRRGEGKGLPVMLWVIGRTRAWKEPLKASMSGQG